MKQVKYVILSLCVIFCMFAVAHADETTEVSSPKPIEIAFPLPWRFQRLIADSMNPQMPLSDIRAMLKDDDSSVRLEAVRTLGERGSQNDLPELEKLASGNDSSAAAAKVASAWIKARMYAGENVENKLSIYLESKNSREQLEAIIALGQINTPASTQYMIAYLKGSNISPYNALRSLLIVGQRNSPETMALTEKFFSQQIPLKTLTGGLGREHVDGSADVDLAKAYWNTRLTGISAQEKITIFSNRYNAELEHSSAKKGVPIYGMEKVLANSGTGIVPMLKNIVLDAKQSDFIKQAAIRILNANNTKLANESLVDLSNNKSINAQLNGMVRQILAVKGNAKFLSQLFLTLRSHIGQTIQGKNGQLSVIDAAWTLSDAAKNNVVEDSLVEHAILPYLKLADWEKGSYLAALIDRRVGGTESAEPLINLIEHGKIPDDQVAVLHNSSITTLGYVGARVTDSKVRTKVLFFLIHQCYDKDPVTRIVAVQALARMAGAEGIPVIVDMAKKEKDGAAMRFEISGIYKAGGPDAVTALEQLRQFAVDSKNDQMQELCEEGLLRLKREGRDKEVKPVTYPGDSGGMFD